MQIDCQGLVTGIQSVAANTAFVAQFFCLCSKLPANSLAPFTVSAVAANTPLNSSIRFDLLLPIQRTLHQSWSANWTNSFLNTFFLLRPNANIHSVEKKMDAIRETHTAQDFAAIRRKYPNIYYHYKLSLRSE
jgi:hypothetical protein